MRILNILTASVLAVTLAAASAPAVAAKNSQSEAPRLTRVAGYVTYDGVMYGNICRNNAAYCVQAFYSPVGGPCYCVNGYGNVWMQGLTSTY